MLLIITFRPEFTPPWIGRPHVTLLTLNRLPPRQRAEMIAHVTGGKALPKEIADQIIDRTDGVPLFIEELTKTVVESGIVTEAGDHYAVAGPVAPLAIPTTLHASLLARLDRLGADAGGGADRRGARAFVLARADQRGRCRCRSSKLDDALEQLVRAELIFRRGTPPDAEYTFKHALVQDAAYSTLLRSRRQQLHGRIATTLEAQFPEIVRDAAGTAGAALRGSGLDREGGRLLAQGGPAGDRTVGDDRGGGAAPKGPRPPFRRARRRCAPGAGARSADHTWTRANCDEGICRAGAG